MKVIGVTWIFSKRKIIFENCEWADLSFPFFNVNFLCRNSQQIVWVYLTILWGWCLKG